MIPVLDNEKFSDKGHNNCICKECLRKARDGIHEIGQCEEIFRSVGRVE